MAPSTTTTTATTPVLLHVYDVTNSTSQTVNSAVSGVNSLARAIGGGLLGGIYHGGVEVFGREWSFGFVEGGGSGVYPCDPKKNPMYTYRETIDLGTTSMAPAEVRALLAEMSVSWRGDSYALLTRNCVHFCEELCEKLGCTQKVPRWVNAAASGAERAARGAREAKVAAERAARGAMEWLQGAVDAMTTTAALVSPEDKSNSNGSSAAAAAAVAATGGVSDQAKR